MKSIIITGEANAGKSTAINEICRRLNPEKVWKIETDKKNNYASPKKEEKDVDEIFNDTFLIQVKNKNILVVAGASTEQNITITILLDLCVRIGVEINFALVAKRAREKEGYKTIEELKKQSEVVLIETVLEIDAKEKGEKEAFRKGPEWNNWIDKIKHLVLLNISENNN